MEGSTEEEARIQVGEQEQQQAVAPDAKQVAFTLALAAGPTHLQTYFGDEQAMMLGAYYVYIDRVPTVEQ